MTAPISTASIGALLLACMGADAENIQMYQGSNPSGATNCVSDPTLVARHMWDSFDLISSNQSYMSSIGFGPGCPNMGCVLLLPEQEIDWLVNYPMHRRHQWLNVFLGGQYTMSTAARLMADGTATSPLQTRSITGLVAPARCSER